MVGVLGHQPSFVYGPSSAEAKKTFYFSNSNYYSVELRIVEYTYSHGGSSGDGTGGIGRSAFKIYSVVKDKNNKNIDWANAGPTGHDFDWTDNPKYLINVYAIVKTTLYRNDIPSGESYTDIEIRNLSIPFSDSDFYYRDDDAVALFNYYPIDINGDGEKLAIDSYSIENGYGKGLEYFPKYSSHKSVFSEIYSPSNKDLSVPISKKLLNILILSVFPKRLGLVKRFTFPHADSSCSISLVLSM